MKTLLDWFRRARRNEPFPDDWASFLRDHSAHYRRLSTPLQIVFEQDVQRFITGQRITGVRMTVDDPTRLLVAASAVTLSVGWPGYRWNEASEILLYPDSFDRDFQIGQRELAGLAHVWGTVILSVPSLWHSFTHDRDPYHVGFHEFAHLLTYHRGQPIKIPVGLSAKRIQLWEQIEAEELARISTGDSVVNEYALQPSEFFPCAVEVFFQQPLALRKRHRRLYGFLAHYFRQSPGRWEVQRRAG